MRATVLEKTYKFNSTPHSCDSEVDILYITRKNKFTASFNLRRFLLQQYLSVNIDTVFLAPAPLFRQILTQSVSKYNEAFQIS